MGFRTIRFHGFRNLENAEVELGRHDIVLIGENGQGKTSFLEALYLLSYGSSFRTHVEKDLIAWGNRDMAISGKIEIPNEPAGDVEFSIKNGIKSIRLHGKKVQDRKDLIMRIPTIIFVHEDIFLTKGPQEKRRWFMDQTLSLLDSLYVDQLRRYKKLLKERNNVLKKRMLNLLDHFGEQLVLAGLAIVEKRMALTEEFGKRFSSLYRSISNQSMPVSMSYRPSWGLSATVEEATKKLREKQDVDKALGITTTGPHRDRFMFVAEGRDFSRNASTGQNRLLSLILRVAQSQHFFERTKRKPILLLDDVLLELDLEKRKRFRDYLPETQQTFYTFLPGENDIYKGKDSRTYEVCRGGFIEKR